MLANTHLTGKRFPMPQVVQGTAQFILCWWIFATDFFFFLLLYILGGPLLVTCKKLDFDKCAKKIFLPILEVTSQDKSVFFFYFIKIFSSLQLNACERMTSLCALIWFYFVTQHVHEQAQEYMSFKRTKIAQMHLDGLK